MLTLVFMVAMLHVFWKLFIFAAKAAWSITKILCSIVFLPLFLVVLVTVGLLYVAIPILAIVGLFALVGSTAVA